MDQIFISHSTDDDAIVARLREALGDLGYPVWTDSQEMRGGDALWPEVQQAIEGAAGFLVVVSPAALQSSWVTRELRLAISVQPRRGKHAYPVVPLSLDGTRLGAFEDDFGDEPLIVALTRAPGGVEAALDPILVALGEREPAELTATPQPRLEPLEELVLRLEDLAIVTVSPGVQRASARARLVYEPATPGQREVEGDRWHFVAPLGPLEADELRWYLEKYAIWPSHVFRERARRVEASLVTWGRLLHDAALPLAATANVRRAWAGIAGHAGRRFSVRVDAQPDAGASEADAIAAREAATQLLGLPWELLHDGDGFLFQGATPTRVRRRLPNTRDLDVPVVATPIRILLVSPRPEDAACGYLDHRASALPLVDAMEALAGVVRLTVLAPPTLPALRAELDRARAARAPYHVVHFDGHGVYDRRVGLGGLCFEHPDDTAVLERRRHVTVFTSELGPLLRDHRIPLVVLEACQTAQAEQASESVASEMLRMGVASVVAMSHSVLVETARRFVAAFYAALARGARVGDAMLDGQRALKDDTLRGRIFGAGELRLDDWFVPVLFQERDDPQLFRSTPSRQTQDGVRAALARRVGALPPPPATGFIGRSRDLLALERLLAREPYAVLRGRGGEGKTALAAELARWLVRSHQLRRAAFASVETHGTARAVLDALGRQLVPGYSVATFASPELAEQRVARALAEQPTLLVIDNLESLLAPPFAAAAPDALSDDDRAELDDLLALCHRLNATGGTRLLFTSREALPAPFDRAASRRELHRLDRDDAVRLVERVVHASAPDAALADAAHDDIVDLVEAVHGHARTLALRLPSLERDGVVATRARLVELMADLERRFPGDRERSLFASVELSLARLSPDNRQRARVLGLFHGGVSLVVLHVMMDWEPQVVSSLADELVDTGIARPELYEHLSLDPALCPHLARGLDRVDREVLLPRWANAMNAYVHFIDKKYGQNAELATALTMLELSNLLSLLAHVAAQGDAQATALLATTLQYLLSDLGQPRIMARLADAREDAAARLGPTWSQAHFRTEKIRIDEHVSAGRSSEALAAANRLLAQASDAGERAYTGADHDLALAYYALGVALRSTGQAQQALSRLDASLDRFEEFSQTHPDQAPVSMISSCLTEIGNCLTELGRFDQAASAYEQSIQRSTRDNNERQLAVSNGQLGTLRLRQHRYAEALDLYAEARIHFTKLREPMSIASIWHQTGIAYRATGQPEAAEDAFLNALAIEVRHGTASQQASTLGALGNLYLVSGHCENAASVLRNAAEQCASIHDTRGEARCRNNLAEALRRLGRLDDARQQIRDTVNCNTLLGHAAQPWTAWGILADIETDAGATSAATDARQNAISCYLTYRRGGGENPTPAGHIAVHVTGLVLADNSTTAASDLDALLAHTPSQLHPFIVALRAIAAGSRDRSLADAPDLHYTSAAELLLLLERVDPPR